MITQQFLLKIERLQDDLLRLKSDLKIKYKKPAKQVTAEGLKSAFAKIAEVWMVELAPQIESMQIISSNYLADLNVHFQRILTFSEQASKRSRYDSEIKEITKNFTVSLIFPLKKCFVQQVQNVTPLLPQTGADGSQKVEEFSPTAFLAHSFAPADASVTACVADTLKAIGISVITGGKPKAARISDKVKGLIEGQYLFIVIFARRDKIARKNEWTTSSWLIDEKAYAVGKSKRLIILKEDGVLSIGGIQGDYEFIEFSRQNLHELVIGLLSIFKFAVRGLQ